MPEEYVVAAVSDVPEGTHIIVAINGREVGLFNIGDQYYALPNVCWHQNGPLCRGAVSGTLKCDEATNWALNWAQQGEIIICPWHSMEYHITTGECLAYPKRSLPTYDVWVQDDQIMIRL